MPTAVISPGKVLSGQVQPPPSKSMGHRILIASALAGGPLPEGLGDSQDIRATRACLSALGEGGMDLPVLDCGESGSTLRFFIPIALALRGGGVFLGRGRLMERPQGVYRELFLPRGIRWEQSGDRLTLQGRLAAGKFSLPGGVSSQFVTGLLFALPLVEGESELVLTSPLESRGYVDMTLAVLSGFGVEAENQDYQRFRVPGGQRYAPRAMEAEGDWSQAAFWYAARFLGHRVEVLGLSRDSVQGDRVVLEYMERLRGPGEVSLDLSGCPDLAPPLAAMAAVREGTTRFTGAARLRMKESDRLSSIAAALTALGVRAEEGPDILTVQGQRALTGGTVDSCSDHRIAMMAAVLATRCQEPVTLTQPQCVEKSYPDFWMHYRMLGGEVYVI